MTLMEHIICTHTVVNVSAPSAATSTVIVWQTSLTHNPWSRVVIDRKSQANVLNELTVCWYVIHIIEGH